MAVVANDIEEVKCVIINSKSQCETSHSVTLWRDASSAHKLNGMPARPIEMKMGEAVVNAALRQ